MPGREAHSTNIYHVPTRNGVPTSKVLAGFDVFDSGIIPKRWDYQEEQTQAGLCPRGAFSPVEDWGIH